MPVLSPYTEEPVCSLEARSTPASAAVTPQMTKAVHLVATTGCPNIFATS